VQRRALHDLVDGVARAVHRHPDEVEVGAPDGRDDRSVGLVVPGREHVGGEHRGRHPAPDRALAHRRDDLPAALEHQHRLAEQRQVGRAVRVRVGLAEQVRVRRDAAGEERGDVEPLPGREVVADDHGDLGLEAHGVERAAPAPRALVRS
jgi:hypothetical protein